MIDLRSVLSKFSAGEQREIAYFLSRYFKASPHLEKGGKDIFLDVFDEPVEPYIREATEGTIQAIEAEVGSACEYDEETAQRVLDHVTAFEDSLTEQPTGNQISDADTFLRTSGSPTSKTKLHSNRD